MKVRGWIHCGDKRSSVDAIIEIDDDELEGMTEEERDTYITSQVYEMLSERVECGYEEIE